MNELDLKSIIEQHPDCVTNGSKLKGIILDLYPDTPKAVINTLVLMANSGIAKEIQNTASPTEFDKSRWQQKLEDEGFAENVICTCLNIFFYAVGFKVVCVQNDTKVDTSYIVEKKIEKQILLTDLSDFEIKDGVLVKYKGTATDIIIPREVISIGAKAFMDNNTLMHVSIPSNIINISDYAFCRCKSLTDIIIPDTVSNIGVGAFFCCSSLTNIIIPEGVLAIKDATFCGCENLIKIEIPKSIKSICDRAFEKCNKLEKIYYNGDIYSWLQIEGLKNLMLILSKPKELYFDGILLIDIAVTARAVITDSAFCRCSSNAAFTA